MIARRWLLIVALAATAGACVNNYVVDDDDSGTSGPQLDSGASVGGGNSGDSAAETRNATGGMEGSGGSVDTSTGARAETGGTGTSTGSPTGGGPLEACQPCEDSPQCGDEFDLCVMLGDNPVCMNNCGEAPEECPPGLSCTPRESIDAVMGSMCVPDSGACGRG